MSATANATSPSPSNTAMGTQSHTPAEEQTVDAIVRRVDRTKETSMLHRIVALVAAGMLLDGIDVYMASTVASSSLASHWSTVQENSYFLSAGFAGLLIGSLLAGFVGDLKGRRVAYQLNLLLFGGFTLIGAFSPNMTFLTVCRLGAGIGLGAEIVTGYAMVNEFAPAKTRGRLCAIISLLANSAAPVTMLLCAWIIPRFTWRPMFVAIGVLAGVIWYLRRDIPESPRWLAVHSRYDEADEIVRRLEANGIDETPVEASSKNAKFRSVGLCLFVALVAVGATNVCQYTFTSWVPTLLVKKGINLSGTLWISTLMLLGAPVGFVLTVSLYVTFSAVIAVYTPELFPTKVRFRCVGVANAFAKLLTVLMPMIVGWMLTTMGSTSIFIAISVIAAIAAVVVTVFGTETGGKSVG